MESCPPAGRNAASLTPAHFQQVVAILRYILDHLSDPLTNADVTAVTGLHQNYALSLFSRIMHLQPKRFVTRMRRLRARALLIDSTMLIATLAEMSGFASISQFYQHFTTACGTSHLAFRTEHRRRTKR